MYQIFLLLLSLKIHCIRSTSGIIYTIYRYSVDDCIYEFGIPDENSDTIYNIDIYLLSQAPIYEYGEEILEAN